MNARCDGGGDRGLISSSCAVSIGWLRLGGQQTSAGDADQGERQRCFAASLRREGGKKADGVEEEGRRAGVRCKAARVVEVVLMRGDKLRVGLMGLTSRPAMRQVMDVRFGRCRRTYQVGDGAWCARELPAAAARTGCRFALKTTSSFHCTVAVASLEQFIFTSYAHVLANAQHPATFHRLALVVVATKPKLRTDPNGIRVPPRRYLHVVVAGHLATRH